VLVDEELSTALRMVENHQPALAVLDMSIPGVVETIRQIKELCPQIHLIVLVNNVKGQKDAEELGVDRVLLKGFPAQMLVDVVEELIEQRGSISPNRTNKKGGTDAN
jgi:DNA-binding NarL/FixJ family response regulator